MNTGRGAHSAISSCESTGRSFQFSGPAYFRKLPAIQWYSLGAGDVLDQLAEVAAVQLRAALARGADEGDGEALVVGHRDERRLAVARVALDPDLLRVHGLVGLEVVERAARAPRPGAQRAPVVRLARLALVAQADDALRQPRAVVGLDAVGDEDRVAPALRQHLLLPASARSAAPVRAPRAGPGPARPNRRSRTP